MDRGLIAIGTRPATGRFQPRPSSKFGIGRWLLTLDAVANVLLVAVMVAVVWGSIALHLTQQRGEVERRAERESKNLAQAAAKASARQSPVSMTRCGSCARST